MQVLPFLHQNNDRRYLSMELAGISLSEADGQIFLRGQPQEGRAPVDIATLQTVLVQSGYGECAVDEAALAAAANDCNTKQTPFVVQIAEKRDARIEVQIADDEMAAQLSLTPPQGGKPASIEDVIRALTEAGVVFGVDQEALRQACALGSTSPVAVASGKSPEDGMDASFEELVPQTVDRAPKVDALGFIDYREHGAITLVQAGAPLMRRTPATMGVEGLTIRGKPLPPRPGRDEPFAAELPGARVDEKDGNLLTASITGQPVRVRCGVSVEPVLRVAEVNLATGNIYFNGTVEVEGEVIQGMKIQAGGDIVVGGTVDGAHLEAGGNIQVSGGVIANAHLRARGSVTARFAESSNIYAGTVIALNDMALECDLQALNQIIVGVKAPQRGRLTGGTARAMMLVKTPMLGSNKGGVTHVVVGANPELELQYQTMQQRIDKEKANEENLQKLVQHLSSVGDPKGMLDRVKVSWRQAMQVWGKSLVERGELDKELARTRNAKVEVSMGVMGGVDLAFGGVRVRLRKDYAAGRFSIDPDGRIVFTDPQGKASPAT
jgi:uncharacterized protein (DUF342 family)